MARGERTPSRVWRVTRRADGVIERRLLDPKKIQARNKAAYEKRQILAARRALGLSQAGFAQLLGVSINTPQNWEQGRREPTGAARVLLRIAASHPETVLAAA